MIMCFDISQKAVIWFALHAEKYMSKLNGGQGGIIVNVASLAGNHKHTIYKLLQLINTV